MYRHVSFLYLQLFSFLQIREDIRLGLCLEVPIRVHVFPFVWTIGYMYVPRVRGLSYMPEKPWRISKLKSVVLLMENLERHVLLLSTYIRGMLSFFHFPFGLTAGERYYYGDIIVKPNFFQMSSNLLQTRVVQCRVRKSNKSRVPPVKTCNDSHKK